MSRIEETRFAPEFDRQHDQLMQSYHEALYGLVNGHDQATDQIAQAHSQNMDQRSQDTAGEMTKSDFEKILDMPGAQLTRETADTALSIDSLFDASSKDFERILSPVDQQHLTRIKQGAWSIAVRDIIGAASSVQAQSAMRAALDKLVWEKAKEDTRVFGLRSKAVRGVIEASSCPLAQAAMRAALDKLVWEKAKEDTRVLGRRSSVVRDIIGAASSPQAQSAMRAALDKLVWEKAKEDARFFGRRSIAVRDTIGAASSPQAQSIMSDLLDEEPKKYEPFDFSSYTYTGRRPGDGDKQQTPPRTHEAPRPRQDYEIEQIIRTVLSNPDVYGQGWLLTEDRAAIRKVINAVEEARGKAQADGEEITDREIYFRYRKLVDQPEGEAPNEQHLRSFKILQALMGGSHNGKLPF